MPPKKEAKFLLKIHFQILPLPPFFGLFPGTRFITKYYAITTPSTVDWWSKPTWAYKFLMALDEKQLSRSVVHMSGIWKYLCTLQFALHHKVLYAEYIAEKWHDVDTKHNF